MYAFINITVNRSWVVHQDDLSLGLKLLKDKRYASTHMWQCIYMESNFTLRRNCTIFYKSFCLLRLSRASNRQNEKGIVLENVVRQMYWNNYSGSWGSHYLAASPTLKAVSRDMVRRL